MNRTFAPTTFTVELVSKAAWKAVSDVRLVSEYEHKFVQVKADNLGEAERMAYETYMDQGYVIPYFIHYHHQFKVA